MFSLLCHVQAFVEHDDNAVVLDSSRAVRFQHQHKWPISIRSTGHPSHQYRETLAFYLASYVTPAQTYERFFSFASVLHL